MLLDYIKGSHVYLVRIKLLTIALETSIFDRIATRNFFFFSIFFFTGLGTWLYCCMEIFDTEKWLIWKNKKTCNHPIRIMRENSSPSVHQSIINRPIKFNSRISELLKNSTTLEDIGWIHLYIFMDLISVGGKKRRGFGGDVGICLGYGWGERREEGRGRHKSWDIYDQTNHSMKIQKFHFHYIHQKYELRFRLSLTKHK